MQVVEIFDPSTATGDTFTVPQSAANGKMVIWNESNINLMIAFQNGDTGYVPAWTACMFCGEWGSVKVTWEHQSVLSSAAAPVSQVVVVVYNANEHPGSFPIALSRQTNMGNANGIVSVSTATSVVNDNNPINTQIVESTVSGDTGSAVSLYNNGVFSLGTMTNPGRVSFDNGGITSDGSGNISKVGNVVSSGFLSMGTGASQQTLSNGSTITVAKGINIVLMTSNVTGLLMPMGSYAGQIVAIANRSAFTGKFADHSTSNVINGQITTMDAYSILLLMWIPSDNNQWFPVN